MAKWAFIGAGAIARTVGDEITAHGHGVSAIYSRTKSRADELAEKYSARACNDMPALFACGAEAAYIATPHALHYPYLLACIGAGLPVLCEKAFTVNAAQARRALELARGRGVAVMEGMWTRFLPVVREVIARVEAGEIGEIRGIDIDFFTGFSSSRAGRPQRLFLPEDAGGALLDIGCYSISFCQMFLGKPVSVDCSMKLESGIDTEETIVLGYRDSVRCSICNSFDRPQRVFAKIVGTEGRIELPGFNAPESATVTADGKMHTIVGERGYRFEFDAFADMIKSGETENRLISHADTVCVMEIMDECRRQNGFSYPAEIESV